MKKYILVALLVGALLVTPALAVTECPEGEHWVEAITEGYYSDGECNSWSETTCLSSHQECTGYSWHWSWSQGWHQDCNGNETVCDESSTPECLDYEQVWNEPVDEGTCVVDDVEEDEPEEETSSWSGGVSWLNFRTSITSEPHLYYWQPRVIHFLSSHNGIGGILLSHTSRPYYVDTYHQLLGVEDGNISSQSPVLGATAYNLDYKETEKAVYHSITIPSSVKSGWYYVRPYLTSYENPWNFTQENGKIYGNESYIYIE